MDKDEYKGFKIAGHAGYAESGYDIICAGVSVLAQNTVNSIEEFTNDGIKYEVNDKKGILRFKFTDKASDESILLMRSLELGIKSILESCNDNYIKITYKEV